MKLKFSLGKLAVKENKNKQVGSALSLPHALYIWHHRPKRLIMPIVLCDGCLCGAHLCQTVVPWLKGGTPGPMVLLGMPALPG